MKSSLLVSLFLLLLISAQVTAQPTGCNAGADVLGNPGQSGLIGEYVGGYFSDNPSYFSSSVAPLNRVEANLNYTTNNWGAIVPPAAGTVADPDSYSSRYRGSIYLASGGMYTFYLTSDDASYLWIDNNALAYPLVVANALINNGGTHGDITVSATTSLTAGFHNIQILFGEQAGGNHLVFEYSATSPSIARQVVPGNILCTAIQPSITPAAVTAPPGCSCAAGVTSEFYTGYFSDDQSFFSSNSPVINRVDPQIGFTTDASWGNVCPPLSGSNTSPETYSTRFTGQVYIATAGTYTFYLTSDDAAYMWLDGNALAANPTAGAALISNGGLHSPSMLSATVSLAAGLHDFKIHYGENTGNNVCYLEYASADAGIARQVIPQSAYCSCLSTTSTLPVELLSFAAIASQESSVLVTWSTATEQNNRRFDIERSADGLSYEFAGSVYALAKEELLAVNAYSFVDQDPLPGLSYYRLTQEDNDGRRKHYGPVSVERRENTRAAFKVYPNPNAGAFTLLFPAFTANRHSLSVSVLAPDGSLLFDAGHVRFPETGNLEIDLGASVRKGLYVAVCVFDGVKYPLKISVN